MQFFSPNPSTPLFLRRQGEEVLKIDGSLCTTVLTCVVGVYPLFVAMMVRFSSPMRNEKRDGEAEMGSKSVSFPVSLSHRNTPSP
ncbi:hypothetical protein GBA52_019871 [Prunus armeniaca]|nr:hypothetical protein GBA52_019871 [Prunus armeniaca]